MASKPKLPAKQILNVEQIAHAEKGESPSADKRHKEEVNLSGATDVTYNIKITAPLLVL